MIITSNFKLFSLSLRSNKSNPIMNILAVQGENSQLGSETNHMTVYLL